MENTKLMWAVEFKSAGTVTYNIFDSLEKAKQFATECGADAIEIWSAQFNVECIYVEDGGWNYNDTNGTYDASTRKQVEFLRYTLDSDETVFMRKTKEYQINTLDGKVVCVRKWWIQDDIANDYENDWEMMNKESEEWRDALDDDDEEIFSEFVDELS